ncbi:hypothetical protein QQP08_014853 [Theobroma cacao]|nr:hypothetical protein QQP08_014853 [Theobroma cacao]
MINLRGTQSLTVIIKMLRHLKLRLRPKAWCRPLAMLGLMTKLITNSFCQRGHLLRFDNLMADFEAAFGLEFLPLSPPFLFPILFLFSCNIFGLQRFTTSSIFQRGNKQFNFGILKCFDSKVTCDD